MMRRAWNNVGPVAGMLALFIALGQGFPFLIDESDRGRANESQIHIDFMIGSPEMTVTGISHSGERIPVLEHGNWLI